MGLMITDFTSNYFKSKQELEFRSQMIDTDYSGASYYLNNAQNTSGHEFSELLKQASKEYQVSIFFMPNYVDLKKDLRESLFFYVRNDQTITYLNSKSGGSSEGCQIYTTKEMENTCRLLTVRESNQLSLYPMDLLEEHNASTGGLINITAMNHDSINKSISYIKNQIKSEITPLNLYDESALRTNEFKTVLGQLDLNYLIVGVSFIVMISLLLFYNIKKCKKEIVIKKSLGYSGLLIITQFINNYFFKPALVAFCLFPIYLMILSINFNKYIITIFMGYALLFILVSLLVLLASCAIYYSVFVTSNSELLKGRGKNNAISSSVFIVKLIIVPILLMTAFFSINSNVEFQYFANKKQYYLDNLENYKVLDVSGTQLYGISDEYFYNKFLGLLDHEAFFSLGNPIYMSSITEADSLNHNRLDVSASTLKYLEIERIDNIEIGADDITQMNTAYISENYVISEQELERLSAYYDIVRVKAKSIPNFYAYNENYAPMLESFILIQYPKIPVDRTSIMVDLNKIEEEDIKYYLEEACKKLGVENQFSFRGLSTTVESQYYRTEKQATKEWSSLIPIVALYIFLSALTSYLYFDSKKRKIAIQTIHGYSKIHKYIAIISLNSVIISLSVIAVIILKVPLSTYLFNQYADSFSLFDITIILFGLVLLFVDIAIVMGNMAYFENRSLETERRG